MNIRIATMDDAKTIAKNNVLLAYESEGIKITYETSLKGVKGILSDKSKGFYIVAEENNKIIGQLMITYEWSDWRGKNMWWIQSVYTDIRWRKKGTFRKLVEEIKKMAVENDVDLLRLYAYNKNTKAIISYRSIGMREKPYVIYEIDSNS